MINKNNTTHDTVVSNMLTRLDELVKAKATRSVMIKLLLLTWLYDTERDFANDSRQKLIALTRKLL